MTVHVRAKPQSDRTLLAKVAVLGAGIVGINAALQLQRAVGDVVVLDPLRPGGGASFGNSGLIAVDSCGPMATPGMLRSVPGWLLSKDGPLAVDARYVVRVIPWLVRRLRSGRMESIVAASDVIRALHKPSVEIYRRLLGPRFDALIRVDGHIEAWEEDAVSTSERIAGELRQRHGIPFEEMSIDELRRMVPAITPAVKRAHFVRNGAHTVNPLNLAATLAELFVADGGRVLGEEVMRILPLEGGGYRIVTNVGDHRVDKLVVAGGAWTGRLLAPLGVKLQLEAERGYHIMVPGADIALPIPILNRNRGFAAVPMDSGIRFAGTVEIAGLDAILNERRAMVLRRHAERMFPGLRTETATMWMGFRPSFPDNLPVIDQVKGFPGLYLACGHGHFGVTSAPASALAITALVTGAPPPFDLAPLSLRRFG